MMSVRFRSDAALKSLLSKDLFFALTSSLPENHQTVGSINTAAFGAAMQIFLYKGNIQILLMLLSNLISPPPEESLN